MIVSISGIPSGDGFNVGIADKVGVHVTTVSEGTSCDDSTRCSLAVALASVRSSTLAGRPAVIHLAAGAYTFDTDGPFDFNASVKASKVSLFGSPGLLPVLFRAALLLAVALFPCRSVLFFSPAPAPLFCPWLCSSLFGVLALSS